MPKVRKKNYTFGFDKIDNTGNVPKVTKSGICTYSDKNYFTEKMLSYSYFDDEKFHYSETFKNKVSPYDDNKTVLFTVKDIVPGIGIESSYLSSLDNLNNILSTPNTYSYVEDNETINTLASRTQYNRFLNHNYKQSQTDKPYQEVYQEGDDQYEHIDLEFNIQRPIHFSFNKNSENPPACGGADDNIPIYGNSGITSERLRPRHDGASTA